MPDDFVFLPPSHEPDDAHRSCATTPDGEIHVWIRCIGGHCPEGAMHVVAVSTQTSQGRRVDRVLTDPAEVDCTGDRERHVLDMRAETPCTDAWLAFRFQCGDHEAMGRPRRRAIKNEG